MSKAHSFPKSRQLGRSGLTVGPLGLASSYGGTAQSFEEAFEHGCNYFYWGTYRRKSMGDAIRTLAPRNREKMVITLQTYSRWPLFTRLSLARGLKKLKLDYADILLLGWYNKKPSEHFLEEVLKLKEKGLVRKIAISCHHRPSFQDYIQDSRFDAIMVRYNAAHRGAEREVFPFLDSAKSRPGVIAYTTTRWGYLIDPRYTPAGLKTPTATDCYRFSLTNPHVDLCLTGPSTAEQMHDNLRALELGPMSEEELAWMKAVGDHVHTLTRSRSLNPFMQRAQ